MFFQIYENFLFFISSVTQYLLDFFCFVVLFWCLLYNGEASSVVYAVTSEKIAYITIVKNIHIKLHIRNI